MMTKKHANFSCIQFIVPVLIHQRGRFLYALVTTTVADPGFFIGGIDLVRGGGNVDSRGGCVSKILNVETKESGPLGGCALGTPPRSANELRILWCTGSESVFQ